MKYSLGIQGKGHLLLESQYIHILMPFYRNETKQKSLKQNINHFQIILLHMLGHNGHDSSKKSLQGLHGLDGFSKYPRLVMFFIYFLAPNDTLQVLKLF